MATIQKINKKTGTRESTFDRVPPQSLEAEMAVLGSMLIDNDCIGKVVEVLNPPHFYRTSHRKIYSGMLSIYGKNEPIDLITLSEELKQQKILEEVGGSFYLTELAECIPSSANVEHHARIVLEKALLRILIEESVEIAKECYDAVENVYDIIDRSEQRIFGISDKQLRSTLQHISPVMHDAFETIERFHERKGTVTGVPTGFARLDEYTSGFQKGDLIIIAGRPSMGKTALSLNMAKVIAVQEKMPISIFSLEMAKRQLAIRLLCSHAHVDGHGVRTGRLSDENWQKLSMSVGELVEAPIYVDDTPGMSVLELRAKARRAKKEYGVELIIIDYLQLMQGPRGMESRQQEISAISRSLKKLARELDIPVIVLSQLSRAVEVRGGDKRPMLSDLRESGALEQDADVVIFVFRPEFYEREEDAKMKGLAGKAEAIIRKNRNGPVGTIHLTFKKEYTLFTDPAFDEEAVGVPF